MRYVMTPKILFNLAKSAANLVRIVAKKIERHPHPLPPQSLEIQKIDEHLTPNMRALRLAMNIADQLFSMGVAANDVVHNALTITNTYCSRPVHIDISYTLLTISQDRGIEREPLTLIRTIVPRDANHRIIQQLQDLVRLIRNKNIKLDDAIGKMNDILVSQGQYSRWTTYLAGGGISAGVSVLYTGSLVIIFINFWIGFLTSWLLDKLGRVGIPGFFVQAIAAASVTIAAATLTWLVRHNEYLDIISYINPTLVVIGGIVLLVAGMMIVAAMQDAIDEYYLTASARILKVIMSTGGIVLGVAIGLYIAKKMGVIFATSPDRLTLTSITYQYIGAGIVASSFALSRHSRLGGVLLAGIVGLAGYYSVNLFINNGIEAIPAYGIAAGLIGFTATIISRLWRVPSVATISAGIVPLVPGISLYNGLMYIVENEPGTFLFNQGTSVLFRAFMIAITIAAGASFGNIVGRPMRRRLVRLQNNLPGIALSLQRRK